MVNEQAKSNIEKEKKLCLCMIVKNESKIIERCLNSAKSIIDYVSICDTGSTDHTPEIIEKWCEENEIPGTVHHEPFRNFGYNRSLAVSLAQETYPESDYLLILDADMILEVTPDFDKGSLTKDHYLTMQYDIHIKYWLTRLLKTSLPWKSVGVTHEYWDIDRSKVGANYFTAVDRLDDLVVNDQGDGGSKADKFERDKRLLLEGIQDPATTPDLKVRYLFYLAQSYFHLNEFEESIKWYKKRVDAGGWAEEVFYSLLRIGFCYEHLANRSSFKHKQLTSQNEDDQSKVDQSEIDYLIQQEEQFLALAITYFQDAWEYRPTRAESLYQLARIYRTRSQNHIGLMYALQGKEISFPKEDLLFVDYHVYDYLFDYEISICAYYIASKKHLGAKSQKYLESKMKELPVNIANVVESNAKFY
ncbi:glycosyltransferase [Bacillus gaemokensis]|uniref:Glycosyl transferase n=1 Tax=Bacillus gaemokensis TaxID=574375 RepID=A0A073K9V9_9BACI|nr:glycosyltransferase [Bacillus gaemokensis]KEK24069.1 glycosyl transferase [Bacillus gaemokensis]KYG27273.1 glycosyl transferase [Bacillus gaemokensis]